MNALQVAAWADASSFKSCATKASETAAGIQREIKKERGRDQLADGHAAKEHTNTDYSSSYEDCELNDSNGYQNCRSITCATFRRNSTR